MNTTKMRINVDQAEAIRQGKNQYGRTVLEINPADLTSEQRETLAMCWTEYDREDGLSLPYPQQQYSDLPKVGEATLETARFILDAYVVARARAAEKKRREYEEEVSRGLDLPLDELMYNRGNKGDHTWRWVFRDYGIRNVLADPRLAEKIAEAKQEIARRNAELDIEEIEYKKQKAEREAKEAAEKKEQERLAAEKAAHQETQIAAWVAAKGTDNQKKRAALNLLPRDEALNDMRDEAFAPLDGFDRYEKITKSDIACTCDEEYGEPVYKYRAGNETEATAEDFDRMEQIRELMPGAVVTLRWHQGWCDPCYDRAKEDDQDDMIFKRHSIRVAITVGDFEFTREYAC